MFSTFPKALAGVFEQFVAFQAAGRLAQAYLLYGAAQAIPEEVLLTLASALLAPNSSLGFEATLRYVQGGLHPNFFDLKPEEDAQEISAEQARKLNLFLQTTSGFPGWRVVFIRPADRLNTAAANILLKNMEELPQKTTIFLVSDSLYKIKKTVLSRTQKVFVPAPQASLEANIATQPWAQAVLKTLDSVMAGGKLPEVPKDSLTPEKVELLPEILKHGLHQRALQNLATSPDPCPWIAAYERISDFVNAAKGKALSDAHFVLALWVLLSPSQQAKGQTASQVAKSQPSRTF